MIGDKLLTNEIKTVGDAWKVLTMFGIQYSGTDWIFENASRLIEINNEVYEKLQKLTKWDRLESIGYDIETMKKLDKNNPSTD